ncbi:YxeA family protein [Vagococcus sp.]|uniref:YxeA family protein n=1 Tax=Vagococcus sp. TaxID=1933889 RepID=UPI003F974BE8
MKKILLGLLLAFIFIGGPSYWYYINYSTTPYYTKINQPGKRHYDTVDGNENKKLYSYEYQLDSFDHEGNLKKVTFNSFGDRELRKNAYLKIKLNSKKGVMSWEEIQENELPQKASEQLK